MNLGGGEFSTGEMGNFHPALTCVSAGVKIPRVPFENSPPLAW